MRERTSSGKTKRNPLGLARNEYVVAAWPEHCSGPGWGNHLLHVIIGGPAGLRRAYVQPTEWHLWEDALTLAGLAERAHNDFTAAIKRATELRT